jgi:hypothetical protein
MARAYWRASAGTEVAMVAVILDPQSWSAAQFSDCILGDARRNQRLIKVAMQMAARPDGSTPDQTETWADCKAAYRLFDEEDVTFAGIVAPHCRQTRAAGQPDSVKLLISDTTELDFGRHRNVTGLGPTGDGGGLGFFLHSSLMIDAATNQIDGLAGQKRFYRKVRSTARRHDNSIRRSSDRESVVWGELIDAIGPPLNGMKWIHVCDRGADDFEVFCRALRQRCEFVIRASRLNRKVFDADEKKLALDAFLKGLAIRGISKIAVRPGHGCRGRTALVEIRFGQVLVPVPSVKTPWMKQHVTRDPLLLWVVELRESSPPKGVTPLRWVLYTSEAINTITDAQAVISHYEQRWTVEDYHKALKTGCHVEHRQYATAARLERVTAVLSILAVRLLQMKTTARDTPDRPAHEVAPARWVEVLKRVRRKADTHVMTIREFIRELAGLGGHLGRKCDGEPGWITLWRGLEKLLLILRGADAERRRKCG